MLVRAKLWQRLMRKSPRAIAASLTTVTVLAGLAAATGQAAMAATTAHSGASPVLSAAVRQHLRTLYAEYRHIAVRDIAPVNAAGVVTTLGPGGREWAMIRFAPAPGAPLPVLVAFQEGAGTGVFADAPGKAWAMAGLAGLGGCGVTLPAVVRQAWHLPSCHVTTGQRQLRSSVRATTAAAIPTGTIADLVKIAKDQIGVADNPRDPGNFTGLNCDPYTEMVGALSPNPSCGTFSNSPYFSNVRGASEEWCSDFVKWVWKEAGVTSDLGTLTPYSGSFITWGQKHGENMPADPSDLHVGDAIVFVLGGSAQHVGIVAEHNSDGSVDLIDGDFYDSSINNIHVEFDTNISNLKSWAAGNWGSGTQWFQVSPQLASPPPPAGVPSGPAVSNPLSGTLEVYGTGSDHGLDETYWAPGPGWTSLEVPGSAGLVAGRPSAVYDPLGGNLEVYSRGTNGDLEEFYYAPGKGWRSNELTPPGPGTLTGSPSAVYDPVGKALEVYVTGSDGKLVEFYWTTANGWQSQELPAPPSSLTGSPSAVYDPLDSVLEVYATGADGALEEDFWTAANGWKSAEQAPPGAALTGSPSAVYDQAGGNLEVYARGSDAKLEEFYYQPGKSWRSQLLPDPKGTPAGSPSAVYDPLDNVLEVYAAGTDGDLEEDFWTPANGWKTAEQSGLAITGAPFAVYDDPGQHLEVYAQTSTGSLGEYYYAPGASWKTNDLGGKLLDL